MTEKFIERVLLALAKERKVFWSEADFQFAFAWKLKEMFEDRNPQSACDIGCYLYLKDVERIEHISKSLGDNFGKGFAIMLTNDHLYWDKPKTTPDTTVFRDFRIYDGRKIVAGQKLNWHPSSNKQPVWQKELGPLTLTHNYTINWKDYSKLLNEEGKAIPFKYSIIKIN